MLPVPGKEAACASAERALTVVGRVDFFGGFWDNTGLLAGAANANETCINYLFFQDTTTVYARASWLWVANQVIKLQTEYEQI